MRKILTFFGTKDFDALNSAQGWCRANGYSVGSLQAHAPIGIMRGTGLEIAKWRNLSSTDREQLDGYITATDVEYRSGPVCVVIEKGGAA
jgi:hypothetical protein